MRPLFPKYFIIAAITFLLTATAHPQEHSEAPKRPSLPRTASLLVPLGTSAVAIPPPDGYEEATSQFADIKTRFSETEAPGNEMLLVHLLSSDCDLIRRGQQPTMTQYTKVSVLRSAKEQDFSLAEMNAVVAEFRRNGAAMMDPNGPRMKAVLEHIDQALKKIDSPSASIDMSKPVNLGEFEVSPNIYSVMILMNFKNSAGEVNPILASMSYMRVRQRLLYVFAYRKYTSKTDVDILRTFAKTWTGKILAAN